MKSTVRHKIGMVAVFCIALSSLAFYSPMVCHGEEIGLYVDFSPKIINISSERLGDIRVFTRMRYSFFVTNGESIFIYFNECDDSVPNVRATRDSVGNLILRFSMDDLLTVENCLYSDAFNDAKVVITMTNVDEYIGVDDEAYINDKKAP